MFCGTYASVKNKFPFYVNVKDKRSVFNLHRQPAVPRQQQVLCWEDDAETALWKREEGKQERGHIENTGIVEVKGKKKPAGCNNLSFVKSFSFFPPSFSYLIHYCEFITLSARSLHYSLTAFVSPLNYHPVGWPSADEDVLRRQVNNPNEVMNAMMCVCVCSTWHVC